MKIIFILVFILLVGCGGGSSGNNSNKVDDNKSISQQENRYKGIKKLDSMNDYQGTLSQYTIKNGNAVFEDIAIDKQDNQYILVNEDINIEGFPYNTAYVLKLDKNQNIIWQYIPTKNKELDKKIYNFTTIGINNDNIYVVGSTSRSNAFIFKLDIDGNLIWKKTFESKQKSSFISLKVYQDKVIAVGYILSSTQQEEALVVEYDLDGNLLWHKSIGGLKKDIFYGVDIDKNGYIYCAGRSDSSSRDITDGNHGDVDGLIVKLDFDGNIIWNRLFGGSSKDFLMDVKCDSNLGCYAIGSKYVIPRIESYQKGYQQSCYILKFDVTGKAIFEKSIYSSEPSGLNRLYIHQNFLYSVGSHYGNDGNFSTLQKPNKEGALAIKFDENGEIVNMKSFDTIEPEEFQGLAVDSFGSVYGVGNIDINRFRDKFEAIFLKFDMK